jgi:multisubunit Na+/H+ antiporter MnhE subunit
MGGGLAASLVWMAIGSPFGLHGFVAGIIVSLISLVAVSLLTPRLPDDHVARVWGDPRVRS